MPRADKFFIVAILFVMQGGLLSFITGNYTYFMLGLIAGILEYCMYLIMDNAEFKMHMRKLEVDALKFEIINKELQIIKRHLKIKNSE